MKRRPNTPTILDWEELENAPNTHGAFSFLRSQNTIINIEEHRQRDNALLENGLAPPDKTYTVDKTTTVDGIPAFPKTSQQRPYRIHRCYKAQDAHSNGENQLYAALWHAGALDGPDAKRITIGWDRMARSAGMSDKAAKRNLTQLIEKLAVDLIAGEDSFSRTGRTYRIHSFKAILEKRNAAGLLFVTKDKGVRFVSEPKGLNLDAKGSKDPSEDITSTVDKASTVDKPTTVTVDKTPPDTVDKTSTPLGSSLVIKNKKTTTTDENLSSIVAALSAYTVADQQAAERIVSGSRTACGDASLEEIAAVIHLKAPTIIRNRAIHNPLGLLMRAVPLCFEESGIRQLRAYWSAEKERLAIAQRERDHQRQEMAEWVKRECLKLEQTLVEPSATESQKTRATRELEQLRSFDKAAK